MHLKSHLATASFVGFSALVLGCSADSGDVTGSGGSSGGGSAGAGAASMGGGSATGGSATGTGGFTATGGSSPSTGGFTATGGSGASTGGASATGGATSGGTGGAGGAPSGALFSFFVTSLEGMQRLSGSQNGFGGDLRHGEASGLEGADKICTELAEYSMPGSGQKGWRAFLSVTQGPEGTQVDAIDRVGEGPWYDRLGRVVAMDKAALLNARPAGADPAIVDDLPNEYGVPNHQPDPTQPPVDNHHVLTGSGTDGRLYMGSVTSTCSNWEATVNAGRPRIGFSWPKDNRQHWISGQDEGGCGAGVNLAETGGSNPDNPIVGSGGGYGAIYCFALSP